MMMEEVGVLWLSAVLHFFFCCSLNVAKPQAIFDDYTCCFSTIFFFTYNETLFSFFINFFAPLARSELKCSSSQCIQWGDGRWRPKHKKTAEKERREMQKKAGTAAAERVEHAMRWQKSLCTRRRSSSTSLLPFSIHSAALCCCTFVSVA